MRRVGWLIAAAMIAGGAWALDPPRPAPAPPPAPSATGEQPAPTESPAPATATVPATEQPTEPADEEETLPPLPPDARRTGPTPQRFDPTEEVRADFPVSFPSDI